MTALEQQVSDHLRRRAAAVTPRYDLEAIELGTRPVELVRPSDRRSRRPVFGVLVGAAAALAVVAVIVTRDDSAGSTVSNPPGTTQTTEIGQPLTQTYDFFEGEVTLSAVESWELSWRFALALTLGDQSAERVELLADPFPVAVGCERGQAPADAGALARSIQSDPDLAVSAPVAVSVGGADGVAMDITVAPGASVCEWFQSAQVLTQNDSHTGPSHPGVNLEQGSRMRLYLVDLPSGSATRILAVAVVAPEASFEDVVDAAAPIIESIQFYIDSSQFHIDRS